jgi:hypothetical protein
MAHHLDELLGEIEIWPHVRAALAASWQTNRGSISDSRKSSGQWSALMAIEWPQR